MTSATGRGPRPTSGYEAPEWAQTAISRDQVVNVLLIEDDPTVAQTILEGLAAREFKVRHAPSLGAGQDMLIAHPFDLMILDLTLPDGSGLELAAALRRAGHELPILMLTARDSVDDRVSGFRHGADDYLCKPFDLDELVARILAIVRRTHSGKRSVLAYADVQLDLVTRTMTRKEISATLSAREAELLAYLIRHHDEILPRDRILQEVWGDEAEGDSNVLNVYINYLRNKIEAGLHPRIIHTIRGVGYAISVKDPDELG